MIANKDPFIRKYNELDEVCGVNREKIIAIWKKRNPKLWANKSEEEKARFGKGTSIIKVLASLLPKKEREALMAAVVVRNTIHDKRNLFLPTNECLKFMEGIIMEIKNGNIGSIDSELANVKKTNVLKMKELLKRLWEKVRPLEYEKQEPIKEKLSGFIKAEKEAKTIEEAQEIYEEYKNFYNNIPFLPEVRQAREKSRQRNLDKEKREVLRELDGDYYDALQEIKEELRGFKQHSAIKLLKEKYMRYKMQIESCIDYDELEDIDIDLDCFDDYDW